MTDDGPGVPANQRQRIFERFARRDDARARDAGGAGLGLGLGLGVGVGVAIVAEVARAHGGTVRGVPAPTGGARFEFTVEPGTATFTSRPRQGRGANSSS